MTRVTRLVFQKRNKERVNVYLDDEYAFSLAATVAADLQVGQILSPDGLERLHHRDAFERGKQVALRYLSYRPRSAAEVRRHLAAKGLLSGTVDEVIDRLTELNLVDDLAFARYWIEQRETFRPRSKRALAYELHQKGVSRATIDRAIAAVDEIAAARRAARARLPRWLGLPREEFSAKVGRFLQSRGFNYDIIRQVESELWRSTAPGQSSD